MKLSAVATLALAALVGTAAAAETAMLRGTEVSKPVGRVCVARTVLPVPSMLYAWIDPGLAGSSQPSPYP